MIVAVTGGRKERIRAGQRSLAFKSALSELGVTVLHHGNAYGIDRDAAAWVKLWNDSPDSDAVITRLHRPIDIISHPADWNSYGKSAGFIRNREMLLLVETLIAFPGGKGTAHCVKTAEQLGLPIYGID